MYAARFSPFSGHHQARQCKNLTKEDITRYNEIKCEEPLDVCLSVHRCICVEKKNPTRCHWMVYCTYNMLNMFRALLFPPKGTRDYMCYYRLWYAVLGCWLSGAGSRLCVQDEGCCTTQSCNIAWLLVVGGQVTAGCVSRMRNVARLSRATSLIWTHSLLPCTWTPTASNQALHTIGGNNAPRVSSSWWWALTCPKHVEHIIKCNKPFSGI